MALYYNNHISVDYIAMNYGFRKAAEYNELGPGLAKLDVNE